MAQAETSSKLEGACLCGAVTLTVRPDDAHVEACHCETCRLWGSGAFVTLPPTSDLTVAGEEHVVRYRSSDWAERGFCGTCGTHLFYHLLPANSYICASGPFRETDAFPMSREIFIDEKPDNYAFAGDRDRMTGAEVFAKFAPGAD